MEVRSGHKRTEVGVIPQDWQLRFLRDVADFLDGRRKPVKDADRALMRGSIPYYGASGVIDYVNDYLFDEDLILLGEDGENILSRNCPLAFRVSGKIWVNNHAHVLRPSKDISHGFLANYLESINYERFNSGTAQPKLNKQTCYGIPVALPPNKAEQDAIAAALSDADALIESLEQLIAKKRQIKQGVMQELLTGKRRLPGFSAKWARLSFSDVLDRLNVKAHQISAKEYQSTGQYPIIDQGQRPVVAFSDNSKRRFVCPASGVIVFGDHTCIVKFIDSDFLVGAEGTQVIRGKDGQCTRFHALSLQHAGIVPTGYNRHFGILVGRAFWAPPKLEQEAIAESLTAMDDEISALEARLSKARAVKQGMMQELLTGRIRLV